MDIDRPLYINSEERLNGGRTFNAIAPLLTCGHYAKPVHERSSVWDFPEDPLRCPEGCGERQMDLELQLRIQESWQTTED